MSSTAVAIITAAVSRGNSLDIARTPQTSVEQPQRLSSPALEHVTEIPLADVGAPTVQEASKEPARSFSSRFIHPAKLLDDEIFPKEFIEALQTKNLSQLMFDDDETDSTADEDNVQLLTGIHNDSCSEKVQRYLYKILEKKKGRVGFFVNWFLVFLIILTVFISVLSTEEKIVQVRWISITFFILEHFCLFFFTLEYVLRVFCITTRESPHSQFGPFWGRLRYMFRFTSIIDVIAVIPTYVSDIVLLINYINGTQTGLLFVIIRELMVLRILRLLQLAKAERYFRAWSLIKRVVIKKQRELFAAGFITFALIIVVSSLIYYIERYEQPEHFASIPQSMYWAVVTLSTVGYGDIAPKTVPGRIVSIITCTIAVGLFAFPTSILGSGFIEEVQNNEKMMAKSILSALPVVKPPDDELPTPAPPAPEPKKQVVVEAIKTEDLEAITTKELKDRRKKKKQEQPEVKENKETKPAEAEKKNEIGDLIEGATAVTEPPAAEGEESEEEEENDDGNGDVLCQFRCKNCQHRNLVNLEKYMLLLRLKLSQIEARIEKHKEKMAKAQESKETKERKSTKSKKSVKSSESGTSASSSKSNEEGVSLRRTRSSRTKE